MSIVSNNLKYLRRLNGLTQEQFARRIGIKRSLLGAYEEARANPNLDNLLMIAKVFGVSVDQMLKHDLRKVRETPDLIGQGGSTLLKPTVETQPKGGIFEEEETPTPAPLEPKPLSAIIDKYFKPEESINFVAQKIYPKPLVYEEYNKPLSEQPKEQPSFNSPYYPDSLVSANIQYVRLAQVQEYILKHLQTDFLNSLPKFSLPNLPKGEYRGFEAGDDFSFPGGTLVGSFVKNWYDIQDGKHYLLVTKQQGLLYRRVYNQLKIKGMLLLSSDLEYITSAELTIKDILEVWEIKAFISLQLPNPTLSLYRIGQLVEELQHELARVKR